MSVTLIKPSRSSEGAGGNFFSQTGISLFPFFPPPLPLSLPLNLLRGGGVTGKGRVVLVVLNLGQLGFLPSYSVFNLKAGGQVLK